MIIHVKDFQIKYFPKSPYSFNYATYKLRHLFILTLPVDDGIQDSVVNSKKPACHLPSSRASEAVVSLVTFWSSEPEHREHLVSRAGFSKQATYGL
ncbi:hypothetical protein T11_13844 [Trichinella zimbabwensis]|uniref:Uncharacterized protein n=1 Tax=Trichinella zimbabwensis TaxID=268475 RepID=A0A0V1HUK3_9BILA|nr:hypothetical protein T11_13844 [Trichinella zimbabwensis]